MIPIPNYINQYALAKKQKNNRLYLSLKCSCGCEKFHILKNDYTDEEKELIEEYEANYPKTGFHSTYFEADSNGNVYSYIKILGIFKKRIVFPNQPICLSVKTIKAICTKCKNEILVFDNRYYGYDGMTSENVEEKKYIPHLKMINKKSYSIEMIIENDESLEKFNEAIGEEKSFDFYSNSFSWIRINKIDENNKKTLVEDIETA
ncbi:MAG: hypothetical protein MST00_01330 [Tenericutes bacterium]|nr:hypothetical protein [Mycoplasmatota bacterium]